MKRPPRSVSLAAAFTLLELLAVIAIISILMGLLYPGLIAAKNSARRTQAQNDLQAIATAVKAYYAEYGKYPPMGPADSSQPTSGADEGVGDKTNAVMPNDNSTLFDTLRALDRGVNIGHAQNPRRIVFFEGKSVSNPDQPRSGFVDRGSSDKLGSFFDPWGTQYNVVLDSNHDNKVEVNQYYSDVPADESPLTGVVAFSLGPDGKLGDGGSKKSRDKNSDDVLSWK